jgi:hypothetical protein
VRFDVSPFGGITAPGDVVVYSRSGVGNGTFTDLLTAPETTGGTTELVAPVDGFSEFVFVSPSNPLPVELAAFTATAEGQAVTLAWQTAADAGSYQAGSGCRAQETGELRSAAARLTP